MQPIAAKLNFNDPNRFEDYNPEESQSMDFSDSNRFEDYEPEQASEEQTSQSESWPQYIGRNITRTTQNLPQPLDYGMKEKARGELRQQLGERGIEFEPNPSTGPEAIKAVVGEEYLKPRGTTEEVIDRTVRNLPWMIGGGPLATVGRAAGVAAAGQTAKELGAGEFGQALTEVLAGMAPSFWKGISANQLLTPKQIAEGLEAKPGQKTVPALGHALKQSEAKAYQEAEKIGSKMHIPGHQLRASLAAESAKLNGSAPFVSGASKTRVQEAIDTVEKVFVDKGKGLAVNAKDAVKAKQSINALLGKTYDPHEKAYLERIVGYLKDDVINQASERNTKFAKALNQGDKIHRVLASSKDADMLIKDAAGQVLGSIPGTPGYLKSAFKHGSNFLFTPVAGKLGPLRPYAIGKTWQLPKEVLPIYGEITKAALEKNQPLIIRKMTEMAEALANPQAE